MSSLPRFRASRRAALSVLRRQGARLMLATALCVGGLAGGVVGWPGSAAQAQDKPALDPQIILNDPLSPTSGNPKGDVTIVAFFDYNCPYCKKSDPIIEKLARKDGKIRIVYKDLPILSEASVYGAQLVLGAKYQGKYHVAKDALMALPGSKVTPEAMQKAVAASGVDMARLDRDLQTHGDEVMAYLRRTLGQARALGLNSTPVYLIGPYKVAAALDYEGYAEVVADARAQNGK
ncbi:DsbA family protein [Xanthobacter sp. TB0139]|uniref:DsbA family protein n=1 Tax=Xanthobacter sp. TB0139 TaxID=3459178 RepID=UPI0040396BB7